MTKADIIENVYEKVGGSRRRKPPRSSRPSSTPSRRRSSGREDQDLGLRQLRGARQERARRPQPADRQGDHHLARRVLTFKPSQVLKNVLNGLPENG
jgi:integration host factor subunit alpha